MPHPLRRTRPWSRAEYDRMIAQGLFDRDERLELLGGELVVREPQGSHHYTTVALVARALERVFDQGWTVRRQGPVALDPESEPEPDLAVVPGQVLDFLDAHPDRPVLIVEVADSSIDVDRRRKGALYARAGVADYWIVNLSGRCLEVYRDPEVEDPGSNAWRYGSRRVLVPGESVSPLARPGRPLAVADLLPPLPPG